MEELSKNVCYLISLETLTRLYLINRPAIKRSLNVNLHVQVHVHDP